MTASPARPVTTAELLAAIAGTWTPEETLATDPGAFGAALGLMEFGEGQERPANYGGTRWTFDRPECRVVCYPEDGDRVVVLAWDRARPEAKLEAYRMEFTGSTPIAAVAAAIASIVQL